MKIKYKTPLEYCPETEREENSKRILESIGNSIKTNDKLKDRLKRYLEPFTQNDADQEDIIGEYFLNLVGGGARTYRYVINEREDLLQNGNLMMWFKKGIKNASKTYSAKYRRSNLSSFSQVEQEEDLQIENVFESDYKSPQEEVIKDEVLDITRKNLLKLNSKDRNILSLYFFLKLKYLEISHLLDVPIDTVKTRLRKAKIKFKGLEEIARLDLRE